GVVLLLLVMLGLAWRALRDLRGAGRDARAGAASGGRDAERTLTAIALIGTLIATAVVGAFDAVLLIAVPTFFVWTLAGALVPPPTGGRTIETGVRWLVPLVAVLGIVAVGRAALQFAAMSVYSGSTRTAAVDRAATLDPGSYRILTRAAALHLARGDCARARPPAHAAHALYPTAAEPRRQIADCARRQDCVSKPSCARIAARRVPFVREEQPLGRSQRRTGLRIQRIAARIRRIVRTGARDRDAGSKAFRSRGE